MFIIQILRLSDLESSQKNSENHKCLAATVHYQRPGIVAQLPCLCACVAYIHIMCNIAGGGRRCGSAMMMAACVQYSGGVVSGICRMLRDPECVYEVEVDGRRRVVATCRRRLIFSLSPLPMRLPTEIVYAFV